MQFGKRVDKAGGLRKALREDVLIPAAMMTTTESRGVDLLDVSTSGAKLRGHVLPAPGDAVLLILGRLEAFGYIVWQDGNRCGVRFDVALSESALAMVESERGPSSFLAVGPEAVLAAGDWQYGLAR